MQSLTYQSCLYLKYTLSQYVRSLGYEPMIVMLLALQCDNVKSVVPDYIYTGTANTKLYSQTSLFKIPRNIQFKEQLDLSGSVSQQAKMTS